MRAVAARDETDEENPLAAARRASGSDGDRARAHLRHRARAPTAPASRICSAASATATTLGAAYLAAASHAYGGADGDGTPAPGAFAERVASADLLVHPGDDPGRDLLEGAEDAAFVGGFAAAAATLGRTPDLDHARHDRSAAAARAAARRGAGADRARPRGQPALHRRARCATARAARRSLPRPSTGWSTSRETTGAVPSALLDLVHDAYLADPRVRDFLLRENPAAARAIAERLDAARRHGLWHPRRNDIDADLAGAARRRLPP